MPSEKPEIMINIKHQKLQEPIQVCKVWLRDHCRCSDCYGDTLQRKSNISDIPLDIEATESRTENDTFYVKCE